MDRRLRRSLPTEPVADSNSTHSPRTRSRSRILNFSSSPKCEKSSQGATPANKRYIRDVYEMKSSTDDSDPTLKLPVKSFYGSNKKRYIDPVTRSRKKYTLFSESDSDWEKRNGTILKERNKKYKNHSSSKKPSLSEENGNHQPPPAPQSHVATTGSADVDDCENARPARRCKKFFTHTSPGKKLKLSTIVGRVTSKTGFKLSFQAKKIKCETSRRPSAVDSKELPEENHSTELRRKLSENSTENTTKRSAKIIPSSTLEQRSTANRNCDKVNWDSIDYRGVESDDDVSSIDLHSDSNIYSKKKFVIVSSRYSAMPLESDSWSMISNDSGSLNLLSEDLSPQHKSPSVVRKSPMSTPLQHCKLKALNKSKASPSICAEMFLPSVDETVTEEANVSLTSVNSSSTDNSQMLFPIFSRSAKSPVASDGSYPETPNDSSTRDPGQCSSSVTASPRINALSNEISTPRRSPRKLQLQATPVSGKAVSASVPFWKRVREKDGGMSQMTLDFGQKFQAVEPCAKCGMTFTRGDPTDEATHASFHARLNSTLKFKGWRKERVVQEYIDGGRVLMILPEDTNCVRKVEAVKKIVDDDLGFIVENRANKKQYKSFLLVSSERKIIGFCTAEIIKEGYQVITEKEFQNQGSPTKRHRPWSCSTKPQKALCGINRIWVLRSERKRGVASKLLDCVRFNLIMGCVISKSELAFSDPTPDGRRFAAKYTGELQFLVYKH